MPRCEGSVLSARHGQRVVDVLDADAELAEDGLLELGVVDDLLDLVGLEDGGEGGEVADGEGVDEVVGLGGADLSEAEALVGQGGLDVEGDEGLGVELVGDGGELVGAADPLDGVPGLGVLELGRGFVDVGVEAEDDAGGGEVDGLPDEEVSREVVREAGLELGDAALGGVGGEAEGVAPRGAVGL